MVRHQDTSWKPPAEYSHIKPTKLTIGCPFYQSKWVIKEFFNGIVNLDYPKSLIDIIWVDNGSTDGTYEELLDFKDKYSGLYNSIRILKCPRIRGKRKKKWMINITNSCNMIREYKDKNTDLVLYGSDCVAPPEGIWKLLDMKHLGGDLCGGITIIFGAKTFDPKKKKIIVGPSFTGYYKLMSNGMFALVPFKWNRKKSMLALDPSYQQKVIRVLVIGTGFCLITKEVLAVVKWKLDYAYGEDLRFCYDAHLAGFKIYMDTSLWYDHLHYRYKRSVKKKDGKIIRWYVKFMGENPKRTRWSFE